MDENFDILPILEFAESPDTNEEFDLLFKLRTEQSLHQKACACGVFFSTMDQGRRYLPL